MNNIKIPFGLCSIKYGDLTLIQGDDAIFEAKPTLQKMYGGALNQTLGYIITEYDVSLKISFNQQNYDVLKLHFPLLQELEGGLIDNPTRVDMTGKRLTISPLAKHSKDYDITVFDAYIEPTSFKRTYKKDVDLFEVTFKGKPKIINNKMSWFYIGDFENLAGVMS